MSSSEEHARLKDHVASMDGGLEATIHEGGECIFFPVFPPRFPSALPRHCNMSIPHWLDLRQGGGCLHEGRHRSVHKEDTRGKTG